MIKLSQAAYQIDGQPMFKVLDRVQKLERAGRKILHFELGEPDFDTPSNIVNAGIDALKDAVLRAEKIYNERYDYIVELPAVGPLRSSNSLDLAINKLIKTKGIEVGHIFYFGTKYSEKLGASVLDSKGKKINAQFRKNIIKGHFISIEFI